MWSWKCPRPHFLCVIDLKMRKFSSIFLKLMWARCGQRSTLHTYGTHRHIIRVSSKSTQNPHFLLFLAKNRLFLLCHSFLYGNRNGNRCADHKFVAHIKCRVRIVIFYAFLLLFVRFKVLFTRLFSPYCAYRYLLLLIVSRIWVPKRYQAISGKQILFPRISCC